MMALSGVRSSWLMVATKRLLAALAASAASFETRVAPSRSTIWLKAMVRRPTSSARETAAPPQRSPAAPRRGDPGGDCRGWGGAPGREGWERGEGRAERDGFDDAGRQQAGDGHQGGNPHGAVARGAFLGGGEAQTDAAQHLGPDGWRARRRRDLAGDLDGWPGRAGAATDDGSGFVGVAQLDKHHMVA